MFDIAKRWSMVIAMAAGFTLAGPLRAEDAPKTDTTKTEKPKADAPKPKPPQVKESAVVPKPRDAKWVKRHEGFLQDLKSHNGKVELLFVGDSITDGWRNGGRKVFAENFADKYDTLNIGLSGDRTQHVLWRLENGEMEGIKPKLAMLMIGTNNLSGNTNDEIVAGIDACVKEIQKLSPTTKVLLLGVFPRGMKATDPSRQRIKDINAAISKLDDGGKTVKYLDIGDKFLEPDGTLPKEIMPDALHPNTKGYQIWADAVKDSIAELMK